MTRSETLRPRAALRLAARMLAPTSIGALLVVLAAGQAPAAVAPEASGGPGAAVDPLARALAEQLARAAENPGDPSVANDLGNLLALSGRDDEAEAAYRRAIELAPEQATAHYNLARLLLDQGENFAARRELLRALELDPQNAGAYYYLGILYDRWGRDHAARGAYVHAFELDPRLTDPRYNPDIVGNRAALAAQLVTWSHEAPVGPSRVYDQPAKIAAQAAPPARVVPPAEPARGSEAAPQGGATSGGGFARSLDAPQVPRGPAEQGATPLPPTSPQPADEQDRPRAGGATPSSRVIDSSSLQRGGTVNQVQPASPSGRRGVPQPTNRFNPTPFSSVPESTGRIDHSIEQPPGSAFG